MTDRDRLIELLKETEEHPEKTCPHYLEADCFDCPYDRGEDCDREARKADFLLSNGVIVQKQGKWVSAPIKDKGYDSKTIPTCTSCGYQSFITYTYCPECGAKLKECEG